ncbi:MAG: hypothetical protein IJD43_02650 [Thermoguttaceae bacterium]|nr:hypothetical protein [Thermoguttaceae bacterium]
MKEHSWLFTKKRGEHRTDSQRVGLAAELAFSAVCILAGAAGLIWLMTFYVIPEWKIHSQYKEVDCTLVAVRCLPRTILGNRPILQETVEDPSNFEKEYFSREGEAKKTEKTELVPNLGLHFQEIYYLPEMQLKYSAGGAERTVWTLVFDSVTRFSKFPTEESAEEFLKNWKVGERYDCLIDPKDPDQVVFIQDWQWENFLALIVPASLVFIGVGIGIHALTAPRYSVSKERNAFYAAFRPQVDGECSFGDEFPYVPDVREIIDSPGIRLAYRLPILDSPAWVLFIQTLVVLLWGMGCVGFLVLTALNFRENGAWLLFCYLIAFLAVGVWLVGHTYVQLRNATAVTLLEIEPFPIVPGTPARLFLSQSGRRLLSWINVILVCEEEVVFTHGTNTRREKQRVYQRLIFGDHGIPMTDKSAFEAEFLLDVPSTAMHSFVSEHNQICWRVIVQGKLSGIPMFERSFPIIVCPPQEVEI